MTGKQAWWNGATIYQVYPRSFMDTNGDGIGDIKGIISKLGHIHEMGFDAVWLSPIYPSPMADFGYDVSDYDYTVHSEDRLLEDFEELVATCRKLGLKLILDFVPNHCSSEHPWFQEAISSTSSARRDWFIWRAPAPGGGVPNNWLSAFGGPAWTLDKASGQYWLHSFLPEQPDLNWYNPAVRKAMFDSMRLWFGRGVDGFRVDVILRLVKDKLFRDEPPNPSWQKGMPEYDSLLHIHTRNAEGVLEFVRMLREVTDEYPDKVLIGETYLPIPELMKYYASGKGCHLPFNFGLITTKPTSSAIALYVNEYLGGASARRLPQLGAWKPRCATHCSCWPVW
jgi:alpha-glucosidase